MIQRCPSSAIPRNGRVPGPGAGLVLTTALLLAGAQLAGPVAAQDAYETFSAVGARNIGPAG